MHLMTDAMARININTSYRNIAVARADPPGKGTFVDLGSGTGKTCVAAALIHPFERVVGIELITGLYDISVGVKQIWNVYTANMKSKPTAVEFINDDIVHNCSWHDADVVFANTLAFNAALIAELVQYDVQA